MLKSAARILIKQDAGASTIKTTETESGILGKCLLLTDFACNGSEQASKPDEVADPHTFQVCC